MKANPGIWQPRQAVRPSTESRLTHLWKMVFGACSVRTVLFVTSDGCGTLLADMIWGPLQPHAQANGHPNKMVGMDCFHSERKSWTWLSRQCGRPSTESILLSIHLWKILFMSMAVALETCRDLPKQMDTQQNDSHGILWSLVQAMVRLAEGNAIVERCSAKHLPVCTSGGCHQLIHAVSVMRLCLNQSTRSSRSLLFLLPVTVAKSS